MAIDQDIRVLKRELLGMFSHIQRIRRELAAIRKPGDGEAGNDHFFKMADQLDAIVEATEEATNTIMTTIEEIQDIAGKAQAGAQDPAVKAAFGEILDKSNMVFEACAFQDLTGQRVTKVVSSMKFVEERVNAIIRMWGREELERTVVELQEAQDPEKELLHGPQRKGKGVSQDEVDAMLGAAPPKVEFNQDDIDALFK